MKRSFLALACIALWCARASADVAPGPLSVGAPEVVTGTLDLRTTALDMPAAMGTIVFPTNDGTHARVTMSSTAGAPPDAPLPPNDDAPAPPRGPSVVVRTLRFSFDRDVAFVGFPNFEMAKSFGPIPPEGPFEVQLFDGTTKARLAVLASMQYGMLTYLGQYTMPFTARKSHVYFAELVKSPYVVYHRIRNASETVALPSAGGIDAAVALPPGTDGEEHISSAIAYGSTTVPLGMPPLAGPQVRAVRYVADIVVTGIENYHGAATATFVLPPNLRDRSHLQLAVWDAGWWTRGWTILPAAPQAVGADTVRFTLPDVAYQLMWRSYGLALFEATSPVPPTTFAPTATPPAHPPFTMVMVGASAGRLTVLPGATFPCAGGGWTPLPDCQFTMDPNLNFFGVAAKLLHARAINLAWLGSQTTAETWLGPSMLRQQVPQIPADANVVVLEEGQNDLGFNGMKPETASRVDTMTEAIRRQAPAAKIVYIGLRCFIGCVKDADAAWNAAERRNAALYGAWLDMTPYAGDGANAAFPDGGHPAPDTAYAIGVALADAIRPWMNPSSK